eukprot:XP_001695511.1 predicted protein [Chlamydomonas reinhardtii]
MDIALDGHRVAFNRAFHSIGMDCVSWTPPVYNDLLGISDGTGEGLVTAYYTTVGWPMMLATSDRPGFVKKIHQLKEKELVKLLRKDEVPLRQDVKQVLGDAVAAGAALGGAVRVFTFALAPPADADADAEASTPMLSQMLSAAAGDLKQRAAMQLVCSWKSVGDAGDDKAGAAAAGGGQGLPFGLGVDPSIMAAGGSQKRITPEFLSALIATTGVPSARTVVVAASNSILSAGEAAGLFPVVVPRKFALQGSFPAARAKFDGFGAGLATWPRLLALLNGGGSGATGGAGGGGGKAYRR